MYSSIVVGTDGSETAQRAVAAAVDLARLAGASLGIVSAYEPVPNSNERLMTSAPCLTAQRTPREIATVSP